MTVENAHIDTAIQLAIDFIMQTATPPPPYCILARTDHQAESRKQVFPFGELQQCIRSHFHGFSVQLLPAEIANAFRSTRGRNGAYNFWGSGFGGMVPCDVQMGISCSAILRYMATAILEDREWRNIESAPDFLNELWIYYNGY